MIYGFSLWVVNVCSSLPVQPDQKDRVGILHGDGDTPPYPGERERVAILAQVLHPCLRAYAALLYGGEDEELT